MERWLEALLQLDQQVFLIRYDKHISPPVSSRGGVVFPIRSFNLYELGSNCCKAGIGCKLRTAEHVGVGVGRVCAMRPDTVDNPQLIDQPDEDRAVEAWEPGSVGF